MNITGTIYNVQPYSIHDGPGMRTVVFLKGCPLGCVWCSNPESQRREPQVYYSPVRCISCGLCVKACPRQVLSIEAQRVHVNWERCIACGQCQRACPTEAISISGRSVTPEELIAEIEKDRNYLMQAGGGVTFSGGEPFLQSAFLAETASQLKALGYHIAVETCGYAPLSQIEPCLAYMDLLLYDLKFFDEEKHRHATGCHNRLIKENAKALYEKVQMIFRVPVIPGFNDNREEMEGIASFVAEINTGAAVHLLPYHSLGKSKYKSVGKVYEMGETQAPGEVQLQALQELFLARGLRCEIL